MSDERRVLENSVKCRLSTYTYYQPFKFTEEYADYSRDLAVYKVAEAGRNLR